jgi:hypothetical protein
VRSRDDSQTGGNGGDPASECQPQQYIGGSPNASLPNNGAIVPCGLIAWSFFNDTFAVGIQQPGEAEAQPANVDVRLSHHPLHVHRTPVNMVAQSRRGCLGQPGSALCESGLKTNCEVGLFAGEVS